MFNLFTTDSTESVIAFFLINCYLPHYKFLDWLKSKAFTESKINITKNSNCSLNR